MADFLLTFNRVNKVLKVLPHTGVKERREGKIFKVSGYSLFREIQQNA
jgi:hypothetical protein